MSDFDRASYPAVVIDLRVDSPDRLPAGPATAARRLPPSPVQASPLPRLWTAGSRQIESAHLLTARIRAAANENAHPGANGMGESPTPESEGSDHATA